MTAPTRKTMAAQESALRNLAEGFRYVTHNRAMLSVLSISLTANIFVWPAYQSFMPVFAKDYLAQGPQGLGLLQTAMGVGALIGAFFIASLGNFRRKGLLFLSSTGIFALFFCLFALMRSFPIALSLMGVVGLGSSGFGAMQSTLMLILSSEEMRGRSVGFLNMAIGVLPFGCLAIVPSPMSLESAWLQP